MSKSLLVLSLVFFYFDNFVVLSLWAELYFNEALFEIPGDWARIS